MEEFWIQLLTLFTLLHQTSSASDTTELIGAVGGSVTFRSPSTDTLPALWKFESKPIVTGVFEDPSRPIFYQDKFRTRFNVSERGRALSISQLRMEDGGTYSVNINGNISTFILLVCRELTEPTVSCECQNCSGSICLISLHCFMPDTSFGNVSYTWRGWDHLWDEGSVVVAVNKSSWDNLDPLTCTARNAVSSRNVTVTIPRGLCPENSTYPPRPDAPSDSGVKIWVTVGVIVLVLLLVFLFFFCKFKAWKKCCLSQFNTTDTVITAKYTKGYAEVGPSQQHIPNGINGELIAGESSSTVHSLVKRPEQVQNVTVTGVELV